MLKASFPLNSNKKVLNILVFSFSFSLQNLRNQIMTTNVWVEQVSDFSMVF